MKGRGLALGMLLAAGPAYAGPTLLCQRPEVLQEVGRTVRQWNLYNVIDGDSAIEAPAGPANSVVCHAVMTTVGYVQTSVGWQTRPVKQWRRYDVQVSGNRFFVQVLP